jgi:hypothetical protein
MPSNQGLTAFLHSFKLSGAEEGDRTLMSRKAHWILSSISQKEPLGTEWND